MALILSLIIALMLVTAAWYSIIQIFISPLSKVPSAHWSSPLSRLWIVYHRMRQQDTLVKHRAHLRLGPVIRLAPSEISINCVDGGIRTVYSGGYEKGHWYQVFRNYDVEPMFAMAHHGPHSRRRKMISNVYAKSTLLSSQPLHSINRILLSERMMPYLKRLSQEGTELDVYYLFTAMTMDFVTAYVFGLKSSVDLTRHPDMAKKFTRLFKDRQSYQFWFQEVPIFTNLLSRLRLQWLFIPSWVKHDERQTELIIMNACEKAEKVLKESQAGKVNVEDWPTVYAQLRHALIKEANPKAAPDSSMHDLTQTQRLEVASEMLDHVLAGFDTSSITLTFLAWKLSRPDNRQWQEKLQRELCTLSHTERMDAKTVDGLPVLHAVVMETLRVHSAVPGDQPRVTRPSVTLGPPGHELSGIPGGVRVSAQGWSLHREPSVFPDPETWNPGRWLPEYYPDQQTFEAKQKEMGRWFWAFGSGGRMCVGSNFAMFDMKMIATAIWCNFRTEVVFDEGMVHRMGNVAEPIGKNGKYCVLKLKELHSTT